MEWMTAWEALHGAHFVKIVAAFIGGGVIGIEREVKGKPVGVKTCITIAVTSCILTLVSIQSAEYYAQIASNIRSDPMRLAAQIISGVGFIGAGVIMHRSDDAISGLTTAAMVWAAAAIGITCGAGFYLYALAMIVCMSIAIRISPYVFLIPVRKHRLGKVKARLILEEHNHLSGLLAHLRAQRSLIEGVSIRDLKKQRVEVYLKLAIQQRITLGEFYTTLKSLPGVYAVTLDQ